MLLKASGNTQSDKLRTILLMEADFNMNNKKLTISFRLRSKLASYSNCMLVYTCVELYVKVVPKICCIPYPHVLSFPLIQGPRPWPPEHLQALQQQETLCNTQHETIPAFPQKQTNLQWPAPRLHQIVATLPRQHNNLERCTPLKDPLDSRWGQQHQDEEAQQPLESRDPKP